MYTYSLIQSSSLHTARDTTMLPRETVWQDLSVLKIHVPSETAFLKMLAHSRGSAGVDRAHFLHYFLGKNISNMSLLK